jgi:hypothetical protein
MNQSIVTTPARWFVRGFAVGVLTCASLNALSYFARSEGGGNLLGTRPKHRESLGFPFEMWESGNAYGGLFVDITGLLMNASFGALVGALCGALTVRYREPLNHMVEEFENQISGQASRNVQFSMGGLLIATGLAALVAAATRYALEGRAEVLGLIYLLGPWLLVVVAFLPLGLSWQNRVFILVPMALLLMAAAVGTGLAIEPKLEFDKVLLGVFVCWTPQSALAALALSAALIYHHFHSHGVDGIA